MSAEINNMLDKAEAPEVMVKQIIRDMEKEPVESALTALLQAVPEGVDRPQVGGLGHHAVVPRIDAR